MRQRSFKSLDAISKFQTFCISQNDLLLEIHLFEVHPLQLDLLLKKLLSFCNTDRLVDKLFDLSRLLSLLIKKVEQFLFLALHL